MKKVDVIKEIVKLSKREDYIVSTDSVSYIKYKYDDETIYYKVIELCTYKDTGGGWLKFYTKDVAKHYNLNPVEIILFKELFK